MSEHNEYIIRFGRVTKIMQNAPWAMDEKSAYISVGDMKYELRQRRYKDGKTSIRAFRIDLEGFPIAQGPITTRSLAIVAWPEFNPDDVV